MADTFELEIATPERLLVHEQVASAELPGKEGYLGILPDHAALVSCLGSGVLSYVKGNQTVVLALYGGFVEVLNNHVRVLADAADEAIKIDVGQARQDLEQAKSQLAGAEDTAQALEAISKAQARVDAAERVSGKAH